MSETGTGLKELVELMVKSLVDETDQVVVTEKVEERTTRYILAVAKSDVGKVIGRQGRTIDSMRAIIKAAGAKLNVRTHVELDE